jgi:predicted phage terminase large subunit-like protein
MGNPPFDPMLEARKRKLLRRKEEIEELSKTIDNQLKKKELVDYLLGDFYAFCSIAMGFNDLYEPLHRWLCSEISDNKHNRKLILIPRGHFKTTFASICYPIWRLCKNPCERIIIASYIDDKAIECLEEIIQRIHTDIFQSLFGDRIPTKEHWIKAKAEMIRIPRQGSVTGPTILCIGTNSAEVGRHCSMFIIDDMVAENDVNSESSREKSWAWLGRQLAVLDPGSEMIIIGTPWHSDDVYARLQRLPDWHVVKRSYKEDGKYIFPTRFNDTVINGIREIMNDYQFACFYELSPISDSSNPFNINKFDFIDYDPTYPQSDVWTYILVDPAVSLEEHSCPTGIVIGDAIHGPTFKQFVVKEAIQEKLHPDQLVELVFAMVKEHKPRSVVIEAEATQKTFHYWIRQEQMRRGVHFQLEEVKNPRNVTKYQRLLSLQPYLHNHTIIFDKKMPGYQAIMTEFATYPKGKTDDLICALSFALPIVTYPPRRSIQIHTEELPKRSRLLMDLIKRDTTKRTGRMPRICLR